MKSKNKSKTKAKKTEWPPKGGDTLIGMQETSERRVREGDFPEESESFTPQETGQPDPDPIPDIENPQGAQGGRGPTNQEGEGDRQNSELAALDQVEPDLELDKPK